MKTPSWRNTAFWIILAGIHLFYWLWQVFNSNHLLQDSAEYLAAAQNLLEHGTLYAGDWQAPKDLTLFSKRPIGYPAFLAFFQLLNVPVMGILLIQNTLSIASIGLARNIFLKMRHPAKSDRWLLLLLILTPAHFIYANMIMAEALLQFILILMAWCFFYFARTQKLSWGIGLHLALTAAMLVKPIMFLWVVPHFILLIWFLRKQIKLPQLMALMLIPIAAILLIFSRNHQKTGSYHFSSIRPINLVYYNARYFVENQENTQTATAQIDSLNAATQTLPYPERWKKRQQWALHKISGTPLAYLIFHLRGIAGFLTDPGRFDQVNFWGLRNQQGKGLLHHFSENGIQGIFNFLQKQNAALVIALGILAFANLIRTGLALWFVSVARKRRVVAYTGILIAYLALLTGPLGASRFAVPILPFLLCMAVAGGFNLPGRFQQKS